MAMSLKLNRRTIPALIQERPSQLDNLLLMFNIHALREQWDLLTIAMKLPAVIALLSRDNKPPTERALAEETGLARGLLRRCRLLMDLPEQYRDDLLDELNKPKNQQKLTEDLFIEMERSLTTVVRALPAVVDNRDRVRDVLIEKYKAGVIKNITDFRSLAKIARAERVVATDKREAAAVLKKVFSRNNYSIVQAFEESVSDAYSERDVVTRVDSLTDKLSGLRGPLEDEVRSALLRLQSQIVKLLNRPR